MDLIEPISFVFGLLVGITGCYMVSDLVFSKETTNESDND